MVFLILILAFPLLLLVLIWFNAVIFLNDFSVKNADLTGIKKVLVIFPHPDDEVLTCGGLISKLLRRGVVATLLILTKGERGNEGAHYDDKLKPVRTEEAIKAAKILGFKKLIHEDFGDGELQNKNKNIKNKIENAIKEEEPNLIITYDLSGLYGHPDHIAVSETVTELVKNKYPGIKLWYAAFPKQVLALIKLPVHMAKDPEFIKRRKLPDRKVFVGGGVVAKVRALYRYQSQLFGYRKSLPIKGMPLWFYHSLGAWEYFHLAN